MQLPVEKPAAEPFAPFGEMLTSEMPAAAPPAIAPLCNLRPSAREPIACAQGRGIAAP
jgi:hypothetical protein